MTKIIAFSGKKQSGKTTCANFIYGIYLSQTNSFDSVTINTKGMIEVVKNSGEDPITVDVAKYYHLVGDLDKDILSIIDRLNSVIKIYSFADPLKIDICMNILGLTYDQCYGTDEDKNSTTTLEWDGKQLTARQAMEIIGTSMFRKLKNEVWVESTLNRIQKEQPQLALIVDCRFPNEVDSISKYDGRSIRLTRNPFNSDAVAEMALDKEHYDWSKFDYVLDNENMSIYDQCVAVQEILQKELT
jgi:hypothetical protein